MTSDYKCHQCNNTGLIGGNGPYDIRFCHCKFGDAQRRILAKAMEEASHD